MTAVLSDVGIEPVRQPVDDAAKTRKIDSTLDLGLRIINREAKIFADRSAEQVSVRREIRDDAPHSIEDGIVKAFAVDGHRTVRRSQETGRKKQQRRFSLARRALN